MEPLTHDRAAEYAVLAACLVSRQARDEARRAITGADFYQPVLETIWDAMSRLDRHDKPVDAITLQAVLADNPHTREPLVELVTTFAPPEQVAHYAAIVRSWATKRRIRDLAAQVAQRAMNPDSNAVGFAASVANQFAAIRDQGQTDDVTALSAAELEDLPEAEYDWAIPGLLERGDRLVVTGAEGLGKSTLLRQIALFAAAGAHPFKSGHRIPPVNAVVYDSENTFRQVKRKLSGVRAAARMNGSRDPGDHVMIDCPGRLDITRDRDLARLHRLLDAAQPDLLVVGPLYRLHPRALQTDDEASPVLAALDTVRDRGIALLIEAHAGHSHGQNGREWRPRGSSALMGWPEFGYGMSPLETNYWCDVIPWRGARDERDWPGRLKRDESTLTWVDVNDYRPRGNEFVDERPRDGY